jgi:uncharacterized protein (TIGR02996 family)
MQTEVEAFLKRILAYPDDDAPRLIFADWLEDQAAAHQARSRTAISPALEWTPERGRFIRIQIALARLREEAAREVELTGLSKRDNALNNLIQEEQELESKYHAEWIVPFQGLATGAMFRRGFVEQVNVVAKDLIHHAPELFAASPLRHIRLIDVGDSLPGVFNCQLLTRLAALTIHGSHVGLPLARVVARADYLAGLKTLNLTSNDFDDESVQHLAASPVVANLEELDLSKNDLGETSAQAMAASPQLRNLRTLELRNNKLGPVGAEAIAGSERLANLKYLGLSTNEIGIARLQTLSRSQGFFRVPLLDLSSNKLEAAGLQVILNRNPGPTDPSANRLRDLNLSGNLTLGDDGMRVLAVCRHLENLKVLRLVNCGIGDEGVRVLAASPHLDNVVALDLSNNPLSDTGFRVFLDPPHFRKLKRLILASIGVSQWVREKLNERYPDRIW